MNQLWEWLKRISATWGAFSFAVVVLGSVGMIPGYELVYKKKTEITPRTYLYPGNELRLSAEFAQRVELPDIEHVNWTAVDSSGQKYRDLPAGKEIDIQLLPDYSGILNVSVKAKLRGENVERSGSGSIHIAQTSPQKIVVGAGKIQLPFKKERILPGSLQLYAGSNRWGSVSEAAITKTEDGVILERTPLPVWDGKAFVRYKMADDPSGPFNFKALKIGRAHV